MCKVQDPCQRKQKTLVKMINTYIIYLGTTYVHIKNISTYFTTFSTNNQLLYSKWVWIPLLQYIVPYDQWANILIIAGVNFLKYLGTCYVLNLEIEFFWKKAYSLVHISRSFQDRGKGLLVGSRKLLKELKLVYAWIRKTWLYFE